MRTRIAAALLVLGLGAPTVAPADEVQGFFVRIGRSPLQRVERTHYVWVRAMCSLDCRLKLTANVKIGARHIAIPGQALNLTGYKVTRVELQIPARTLAAIRRRLAQGPRPTVTIRALGTDAAGESRGGPTHIRIIG
jgi:hypothetical protein